MKALHKRVIGALVLLVGLATFTIWVGTWIAIISESGLNEAIRRGYYTWPENVASFAMWSISVVCTFGGLYLLIAKKAPSEPQSQAQKPYDSN
jgi:hypothetical protein